jgi:hypothetical protein
MTSVRLDLLVVELNLKHAASPRVWYKEGFE